MERQVRRKFRSTGRRDAKRDERVVTLSVTCTLIPMLVIPMLQYVEQLGERLSAFAMKPVAGGGTGSNKG